MSHLVRSQALQNRMLLTYELKLQELSLRRVPFVLLRSITLQYLAADCVNALVGMCCGFVPPPFRVSNPFAYSNSIF